MTDAATARAPRATPGSGGSHIRGPSGHLPSPFWPRVILAAALPCALAVMFTAASAQDFAALAPAGPWPAIGGLLESGLPHAQGLPWLETSVTRWYALPELQTRALAVGLSWRALRFGAGLSQTGEPGVGWSATGLALGSAGPAGGWGARMLVRRDRGGPAWSAPANGDDLSAAGFAGTGIGIEMGGGAWLRAAGGVRIWASVPQLWTRGEAPPLERPLEIGLARDCAGFTLWLFRESASRTGEGQHSAGLWARSGPLAAWGVARDRPLRGGVGLEARLRRLRLTSAVESHPVLGETVRVALAAGGAVH